MPKRTLTAALAIGLIATSASAQSMCATRDMMIGQLSSKYGETPQGSGLNSTTKMLEIWASTATGTWTILVTDPNGTSCIMAAGKDWYNFPAELAKVGAPA